MESNSNFNTLYLETKNWTKVKKLVGILNIIDDIFLSKDSNILTLNKPNFYFKSENIGEHKISNCKPIQSVKVSVNR